MKRILLTIFMIFVMTGASYAAGTVTVSYGNKTKYTAELVFTCVGDASDGTIPDTSSAGKSSLFKEYPFLYRIIIENLAADTNVTNNSDVYLKDSGGTDLLNGQGVDQLDDSTRNFVRLLYYEALNGPVTLDVDNQSVASGQYTITLILSK